MRFRFHGVGVVAGLVALALSGCKSPLEADEEQRLLQRTVSDAVERELLNLPDVAFNPPRLSKQELVWLSEYQAPRQ